MNLGNHLPSKEALWSEAIPSWVREMILYMKDIVVKIFDEEDAFKFLFELLFFTTAQVIKEILMMMTPIA